MCLKGSFALLFFFFFFNSFSQNVSFSSSSIPEDLKDNASAVIRTNNVDIILNSVKEMVVSTKRVITVLSKKGDKHVDAYVHYDSNVKIKELQVLVFNALGKEIKKIKKNDFRDVSAVDGGTLYSDSRVKYLDYTPVSYPYTIEFTSEYVTANTAFIRSFMPIEGYGLSVEKSSFSISHSEENEIRVKEKNFESIELDKRKEVGHISYSVSNLKAFQSESYGPSFSDMVPKVMFACKKFTLEGVESEVGDWIDFGKWMYNDLIKGTNNLPAGTISEIKLLVKNVESDIEKAKKIYQYVQNKTRYISVQVGIGGWKPFNAAYVDTMGYGDCKALTNYTMSLLEAVGVKSNYTVLYAGNSQRSLENDFAAMQGNHVILSIPNGDKDIWLECTSQKLPFGFIGDFTDDRDALVITPEGGKIKHTKKYSTEENVQLIKANCELTSTGEILVNVDETSEGIQYDNKYWLEEKEQRDLDVHYKERWRYINNIVIDNIKIDNDKDNIKFKEHIVFSASGYSKTIGNRMLVNVNALNRSKFVPARYRNRKLPLIIKRGFVDIDEVEIKLPKDFKVEALPENKSIDNKFGSYNYELKLKDESTLIYKRRFIVKDGEYPKEDYESYRAFYKDVSKFDNAKMALIRK